MEVSWHPDERIVIISLWSATVCRATFRLPIEEAPTAIDMLATSLGEAARDPQREAGPPTVSTLLDWWRRRGRSPRAEIIRFDDRSSRD
jgi:hypothetical protein